MWADVKVSIQMCTACQEVSCYSKKKKKAAWSWNSSNQHLILREPAENYLCVADLYVFVYTCTHTLVVSRWFMVMPLQQTCSH